MVSCLSTVVMVPTQSVQMWSFGVGVVEKYCGWDLVHSFRFRRSRPKRKRPQQPTSAARNESSVTSKLTRIVHARDVAGHCAGEQMNKKCERCKNDLLDKITALAVSIKRDESNRGSSPRNSPQQANDAIIRCASSPIGCASCVRDISSGTMARWRCQHEWGYCRNQR